MKFLKQRLLASASDDVLSMLGDPNDPRWCFMTGGGFQTQVNVQPAPAVWGDWADTNPRAAVDAGPGGLVAGPNGVTIGRFAWISQFYSDNDGAPASVSNQANGNAPAGFVHREQQGLNTIYLSDASMLIPTGFPVTLISNGGVWAKNEGTTQALPGQSAFASFSNGSVAFAAAGSTVGGATVTGSIGPGTASFTGTLAANQLTVTALAGGTIQIGAILSGTSSIGNVATNTQIVGQLSGTIGGVGVYSVSIPEQNVGSTTMTATYGTLNVTAVSAGTLSVGQTLTGSTTSAGTTITALGTGAGNTGTYIVQNTQTVGSATLTAAAYYQTKWVAASSGLVGELVKMTTWLQG